MSTAAVPASANCATGRSTVHLAGDAIRIGLLEPIVVHAPGRVPENGRVSLPDLDSRERITALLEAFYGQALGDELLGPVFRAAQMDLATHLPRITAFWEKSLLGTGEYTGRPMQVHSHLMDTAGLAAQHFTRWLALWRETIEPRYAGPLADQARRDAPRMADAMLRRAPAPQDLPVVPRP
jgi:hemoglobin